MLLKKQKKSISFCKSTSCKTKVFFLHFSSWILRVFCCNYALYLKVLTNTDTRKYLTKTKAKSHGFSGEMDITVLRFDRQHLWKTTMSLDLERPL